MIKEQARQIPDRRKHQRFKLNDSCILHHTRSVGTVKDISIGGLSCTCLDQGECGKGISTQVNIYCKMHDLSAQGIQIKVLGSAVVPGHFAEDLGVRKCRAMFEELEKNQVEQVKSIIVKTTSA